MDENSFLQNNHQLLIASLGATAEGVMIADTHGVILWVNRAYEKITGYSLSEIEGKSTSILKSGKQDKAFYDNLWSTISAGNTWEGRLWNKKKNGGLYLEEQTINPVCNDEGIVVSYIAIKRDVTQQYEIEKHFQQAQKIEAIGQLTGGVAHNFNNKLATILGYAELTQEIAESISNADIKEYASEIYIAAEIASNLVKQMVSFSQSRESNFDPIVLADIVRESVDLLSASLTPLITIEIQLSEDIGLVRADAVQIHQLLSILVMNAIYAMKNKGTLIVGLRHVSVDKKNCDSCKGLIMGSFVELSVKDHGIGIDANDLQRIFMPFYTTDEMQGKTGMGLSALHGMMHEHGGHVLVESVLNEGALFRLLFPVTEQVTDADSSPPISAQDLSTSSRENAPHILVVENDPALGSFIYDWLYSYGYHVELKMNSQEALRCLAEKKNGFDLLVTNQDMPYMCGLDLIKTAHGLYKQLSSILMTNINDKKYEEIEGVGAVVMKPFQSSDLLKKIKTLID